MSRSTKIRRKSEKTTEELAPSAAAAEAIEKPSRPAGAMSAAREWTDAIVIAYVLAMFIRTFCVELYKIPSGSMTPTLIGDYAAEVDYNNDGVRDLLVRKDAPSPLGSWGRFQIFLREDGGWRYEGEKDLPLDSIRELDARIPHSFFARTIGNWFGGSNPLRQRFDRILVNKFAYWFSPPERGDLIVFKVPKAIWDDAKPIFIKRAVAFEGERVEIEPENSADNSRGRGRLYIDGKAVDSPPIFRDYLRYNAVVRDLDPSVGDIPEIDHRLGAGGWRFASAVVPKASLLAFGDNTDHSYAGRYWGSIPLANLKGRAFLRYIPLSKISFLD